MPKSPREEDDGAPKVVVLVLVLTENFSLLGALVGPGAEVEVGVVAW